MVALRQLLLVASVLVLLSYYASQATTHRGAVCRLTFFGSSLRMLFVVEPIFFRRMGFWGGGTITMSMFQCFYLKPCMSCHLLLLDYIVGKYRVWLRVLLCGNQAELVSNNRSRRKYTAACCCFCHVFSRRSWKWVDKLKRPSLRHCRGRRACVLHVLDLGTSLFSFEIVGWGGRVGFGGCVRVSLLRTHFLLSG